jgi:hypothetical protein
MGLDLVVEGCAKPGYEKEWRRLLERSFVLMKNYRRRRLRTSRRFPFPAISASEHRRLDAIALQTNGYWMHGRRTHPKR